jgi:hypothetical protein
MYRTVELIKACKLYLKIFRYIKYLTKGKKIIYDYVLFCM